MPPIISTCLILLSLALSGCLSTPGTKDFLTLDPGPFRAVYLVPDPDADFDFLELIVQAGELDNNGPEGLAHYVEHLAWLSQAGMSGQQSSRHSNAWTTNRATGYHLSGVSEDVSKNLARLSRVSQPFELTEQFMQEEVDIVQREYDLRVLENLYYPVYRNIVTQLYGDTPLARSTIGTPQSIENFDVNVASKLHQSTHGSANMVLIARGKLVMDVLQAELGKLAGSESVELLPVPAIPDEPLRDEDRIELPHLTTAEMIYAKAVSLPDEWSDARLSTAVDVLRDLLGSTLPGGIAGPLRFDAFVAETFNFDMFRHLNTHLEMRFTARADAGVSLSQLQKAFEDALQSSATAGLPTGSFERIKKRYVDGLNAIRDRPGFTYDILSAQIRDRREPFGYTDLLKAANALTLADINLLYGALIGEGRVVVRHLYPTL